MCGLYGFLHYGNNEIKYLSNITNALAEEAAIRGTDATGIAFNDKGRLSILKESKSAYKLNFKHSDNITALIGHTRHSTQGSEKKNYNNHPFSGKCKNTHFALAHNGVLMNDKDLHKQYRLPKSKIETDSYIAVQLIEHKKKLNAESIKFMAEAVDGSFSFSILDSNNSIWLVKGDSPLSILHFPDLRLYVYASTEEILWKALIETDLFQELKDGAYESIKITDGDILNILPDGTLVYDRFNYTDYSYYGRRNWWDYGTVHDSNPYIEDLKMIAAYQGFDEETIDELLCEGYTPEEVEEFIYCCEYTTFTAPEGISESKADKLAIEAFFEFSKKARGNKYFGENMRFNQLCEIYFSEYAPNKLKTVTIEHYKSNVKNHIAPVFGNRKLKDIATSDVSAFLTGLDCKPLTANKIKIVFHSILKYAVSQKYIVSNPCSGAIWKENTEREYDEIENVLSLQQAQKLMELLDEYSAFNTIIKLLLLTGMRSGECLGLRWGSINFDNKTIFIDKTLSYAENTWFLSTPKTVRSTRTISIDDTAIDILKKHQEEQNKQKDIVGAAWQLPDMVFTSCTGHWYDRSLLNSQFRRFVKRNKDVLGLDHNLTIHGLRHTNAALLLYAGEDIENISAHLGHASSDITSRVYAHMYAEVKVRMAKTVSNALFNK